MYWDGIVGHGWLREYLRGSGHYWSLGLHVKYVNPRGTSKTCPICGNELEESSNGRRLMKCCKCGLEEDRDMIAVKNLTKRYYEECMNMKNPKTSFDCRCQIDVGSPRSPRKPPNEKEGGRAKAQNA